MQIGFLQVGIFKFGMKKVTVVENNAAAVCIGKVRFMANAIRKAGVF